MKTDNRFDTLKTIYDLFDTAMGPFAVACKKGCDTCCTCNVTVTGLEVDWLFSQLDQPAVAQVAARLDRAPDGQRFRPQMTTNGFARASIEGEVVAPDENDPLWGKCPLLENGCCTIYPVRPFGCRNMMSQADCKVSGYARIPPVALTLSTLFMQYIEHLDARGISGNFLDVAARYLSRENGCDREKEREDLENMTDSDKKQWYVQNQEIPALMVPPEHRNRVTGLVRQLNGLLGAIRQHGKT